MLSGLSFCFYPGHERFPHDSVSFRGFGRNYAEFADFVRDPQGVFLIPATRDFKDPNSDGFLREDWGRVNIGIVVDESVHHVRVVFNPVARDLTFRVSSTGQEFLSEVLFDLGEVESYLRDYFEWYPDHLFIEEGSYQTAFVVEPE